MYEDSYRHIQRSNVCIHVNVNTDCDYTFHEHTDWDTFHEHTHKYTCTHLAYRTVVDDPRLRQSHKSDNHTHRHCHITDWTYTNRTTL